MLKISKIVIHCLLIAGAYFLTGILGLSLAFEQANISPVWPSTGLAIAALYYLGLNRWPGVFLGAFILNATVGLPLTAALFIGVGNTFETLIVCWLLHRYSEGSPFSTIVSVAKFSSFIAFASFVNASVGVGTLFLHDVISAANFSLLWSTWWLGDLVGGLVVAPFLLVWANINKTKLKALIGLDAVLFLLTIATILLVFSDLFVVGKQHYPLAFIYLPISVWAGYRFGHCGATLFIIIISTFAIYATLNGYGPFIKPSENESLLLLQSFMAVMMFATLTITASIEEKNQANEKLAISQSALKNIVKQQSGDLETAAEELRLAESVFKESNEPIVITDQRAKILRVNPAFCRVTGYDSHEVVGEKPSFFNSGQHDDNFYQQFWKDLTENGIWQGEIWDQRKNGELFPTSQTVTAVYDKHREVIHYISIFSDISEKKVDEKRIFKLAHFDPVSGLHNRASFNQHLEKALTYVERHGSNLSLLYLDLDNFKLINDASGHLVGDMLLKYVAERLKHTVREEDSIARLGGDEFVVLVRGANESKDLASIANKILAQISKPIVLDNTEIVVTSSIGISTYPVDGTDADSLLKNADAAMYRAKASGRNQFQFFTAEMNAQAQDRLLLESDMRRGIEADEFILHYQPQVDLASNKIIGCEALVRWQHPSRGRISPDLFIPVAEESGLIKELGLWVLKQACSQQVEWCKQGLPKLRMAVNISSRQFLCQNLIAQIEKIIEQTNIDPSYLELELTEGCILENVENNINILHHLNNIGVSLAIDDFGTGYSSMAYLKRFPIDKLKIDQSFIHDLETDPDDVAIVKAIIWLGQSLELKIIAEGVETEEQLNFLKSNGCDEFQGFYFSRPIAAVDFIKLFELPVCNLKQLIN